MTPSEVDASLRVAIHKATDEKIKKLLDFSEHEVNIIIASVADPDRTALRLSTDRTIDALLLAAFQERYVLDNQWIPWRFSLEQMDSDYADRKREKEAIEEQSKFPGVLVLEKERDVLVYLLVPESPTAGVDREVLSEAIRYVRHVNARSEAERAKNHSKDQIKRSGKVPFVGPSFTAGLESLKEWLQDKPNEAQLISRVISGNVTGATSQDVADFQTEKMPFQVVRTPRSDGERWTRKFLEETRGGRDVIRPLVEDSTKFGMGVRPGKKGEKGSSHAGVDAREKQSLEAAKASDAQTRAERMISFPWQISRVRNAIPELRSDSKDMGDYRLQLQMKESKRPEGTLPTFAPAQTPAVQEVVLAQIADRLERDRADYVSIVATDVLDAVFLSRLLHASNPSQRVLTSQPDMIYLREQDGLSNKGLLATGSFPVSNHLRLRQVCPDGKDGCKAETSTNDAQRHSVGGRRNYPDNHPDYEPRTIAYDSEFSAAVVMAALHAIRHHQEDQPASPDFQLKLDGLTERPFWLLGLGTNGYWPIARLDPPKNSTAVVELLTDRPTVTWFALFCLSLAAAGVWLVLTSGSRFPVMPGVEDIHIETDNSDWHKEAFSFTILGAMITLAFTLASAPLWWEAFRQERIANEWVGASWAGVGMLTLASIVPWIHRGNLARQALLLAIACAPLLTVVGLNLFGPRDDKYMLMEFFLLRSQDYLNGIAPLLPLLILVLGAVGYAWSVHIGVVLTQERYIQLGALGAPRFCRNRCAWGMLIGSAAATFPIAAVTRHSLHSLEPLAYDYTYIAALWLLLIATVYACMRFVFLWRNIRSFLDLLEMHPIREALEAMPKEKDGAPVWESHPRRRSSWFYQRTVSTLIDLQILEGEGSTLGPFIAELQRFLKLPVQEQEEAKAKVEKPLSDLAITFEEDLKRPDGPWVGNFEVTAADKLKEQFLAYRFGAFLRFCFLHMRNRITAMTAGFVAITLSLNSYAFGPERMIQAFTLSLVAVMGACVVSVFFQMHRHPMLAMLSGVEGKLDWGLWAKLASAAAIPVLTLVASYTPAVGKFVGAWLQPALEAVGK